MRIYTTHKRNMNVRALMELEWGPGIEMLSWLLYLETRSMAASEVDISSSIDQNEDRIDELTDEELYNLVEETL